MVIFVIVAGCGSGPQQSRLADSELFRFFIIDSLNTESSASVRGYINSYLNRPRSYYLTNNSADSGWPYYGEVESGIPVSNDTLMIPHHTLHVLREEPIEEDGKILRIYLDSLSQGVIWFSEVISEVKGGREEVIARPGVDRLKISGLSDEEIGIYIAKSAIRSTFK